jgi:hypothetical protein
VPHVGLLAIPGRSWGMGGELSMSSRVGDRRQVRQGGRERNAGALDQVVELTGWSRFNARKRLIAPAAVKPGAGRQVAVRRRTPRPPKHPYDAVKVLQLGARPLGSVGGRRAAGGGRRTVRQVPGRVDEHRAGRAGAARGVRVRAGPVLRVGSGEAPITWAADPGWPVGWGEDRLQPRPVDTGPRGQSTESPSRWDTGHKGSGGWMRALRVIRRGGKQAVTVEFGTCSFRHLPAPAAPVVTAGAGTG